MEFRRSTHSIRVACIFDPSHVEALDVFTFQVRVENPHLQHYDNIRGASAFTVSYSDVSINKRPFDGTLWYVSVHKQEQQTIASFSFTDPIPPEPVFYLQFTMHLSSSWILPVHLDESLLLLEHDPSCTLLPSQICIPFYERLIYYLYTYRPVYVIGLPMFIEEPSLESLQRYGIRIPIQIVSGKETKLYITIPRVQNPIRTWFLQGIPRKSLSLARYHLDPILELYGPVPKPGGKRILYLFVLFVCVIGIFLGGLFYKSRVRSDS